MSKAREFGILLHKGPKGQDGYDRHTAFLGRQPDGCIKVIEKSAYDELEAKLAMVSDICDVCAGSGKTMKNEVCICNGTGKMSIAAQWFREENYRLEQDLAMAVEALEDAQSIAKTNRQSMTHRLFAIGDLAKEALEKIKA